MKKSITSGLFLSFIVLFSSCSKDENTTSTPITEAGKILFEASVGSNNQLFTMNANGSNEIQLTNYTSASGVYTGDASWSSDGSKIVFQTNKDTDGGSGIYIMNSDGTNVTRIVHSFIGDGEQNPKFSPNGNKILFETKIGISSHIFVMNIDGTNEIQLTNFTNGTTPVYTGDASWSPDGSKIVFQTNKDTDGGSGIYVMNSDGTNVTRIIHNAREEQNPKFSPNGNKILFEALIGNDSHLFTMNANGTNEVQITNFTSSTTDVFTGDGSWSPDGSKIVFQTNKDTDGGSGVYIVNSDGTNLTRVNHNARDEQNPTWK